MMFQPPDDFDSISNPFSNRGNKERKPDGFSPEELEDVNPEDLAYRKKELSRILLWLMGFGLGLGIIVAIIIAIAMNKLGLTKRPHELKPQPVKSPQEKVEQIWIENLDKVLRQ
ncbi:MAG: hypothetical protein AB4372_35485 [Xenococcus sp. (in: cyanobacteria)]